MQKATEAEPMHKRYLNSRRGEAHSLKHMRHDNREWLLAGYGTGYAAETVT
jgi:hypothetical protein